MTTNPYEFRVRGRPADQALWRFRPPGAANLAPRVTTQNNLRPRAQTSELAKVLPRTTVGARSGG